MTTKLGVVIRQISFLSLLVVLVGVWPPESFGQSKFPVYLAVTVGENDSVGRRFVFELREGLRSSSSFDLIEDEKQWPYIRYAIVTLRYSDTLTVISHTFTYDSVDIPLGGALITSYVQFCGGSVAANCARDMMSNLDGAVDSLRRRSESLWKTLRQPRRPSL